MPDKEPPAPKSPGKSKGAPSGSEGAGAGGKTAEQKKKTARRTKSAPKNQPRQLPPYNVVLLDDDDHTYEYVIEMLKALFAYSPSDAWNHAVEVDSTGRTEIG